MSVFTFRRILGIVVAVGLLAVLACGTSEEDTPTPRPTNTPLPVFPTFTLPATATPTATAVPPGVTAVPQPTATSTSTPVATGEQAIYGGIVNLPLTGTNRWDPFHGNQGYGWGSLGSIGNIFGQFIRPNLVDRVTLEGDLAESWEITNGGKTWVLKMREGVVDHDGNPFTVEDAFYTIQRIIERPNGLSANRWGCVRAFLNPIHDDAGNLVANPGAEITGPNELSLTMPVAKGAWINCFASGWNAVTPDTYVKQIDEDMSAGSRDLDFNLGEVVGTGPFKVVGGELDNFWNIERNDQYFREGLPYLDGFDIFVIPDASTRVASFRVGRVDSFPFFTTPTLRDAHDLVNAMGEEAAFPLVAAPGWRGFELNVVIPPFGPIDDPDARIVRQAIQTRMDRGEMNTLCHDGIGFFSTPYFIGLDWVYTEAEWFENMIGLDPDPVKKAADLVQAKAMMESVGYGPNNRISTTMLFSTEACRSDVIRAALSDIYIDAEKVNVVSSSVVREKAKNQEFGLRLESKGASFVDPDAFTVSILPTFEKGGFTFSGWDNPAWEALSQQELLLNDFEERAVLLREMADIQWNQDAAWIGMVRPGLLQGHRGNWRGWVPPLFHASNYSLENVWLSETFENPYPPLPALQ